MATAEEVNLQQFKDVHHTLTEGKAGVKDVGPVFAAVTTASQNSAAILDALTPGVAGIRHAGYIVAQLGRIETNTAVTQNLIKALSNVSGGEAFDEAKLLAGVQAAAEAGVKAAIESIDTTVTIKE